MKNPKTVEQMRALLREQEQSGLSVKEYAERRGLAAGQLYDYRQRMKAKTKRVPETSFVPVLSGKRITLELSNGRAITFAREHLPEIMAELTAEIS